MTQQPPFAPAGAVVQGIFAYAPLVFNCTFAEDGLDSNYDLLWSIEASLSVLWS